MEPYLIPFICHHDVHSDRFILLFLLYVLDSQSFVFLLFCSLAVGNLCMITGGRNLGRVGTVVNRERHPGSFDIVHVKDSQGHTFATR